jgi:hypothetical protein
LPLCPAYWKTVGSGFPSDTSCTFVYAGDDLWKKFVFLSGTSGITASTRQPLGLIRDDPDMRALLYKLMHETIAVGRAAGVDFPPDFAADLDRSIAAFPPTMKASMANDLDAAKPLELDWLAVQATSSPTAATSSRCRSGRRDQLCPVFAWRRISDI